MNRIKYTRPAAVVALVLALLLSTGCFRAKSEEPAPSQGESIKLSGWKNPLSRKREGETAPAAYKDPGEALAAAKNKNAEVVGWLEVPGTTLYEAVVQTADNEYYYRRNAKKEYSFSGSIWMDYEVEWEDKTPRGLSQNTILYGHNLGSPQGVRDDPNGEKFAQLFRFDDIDFAREHPYFYFTTEGGTGVYEIFSVFYSEDMITPVPYHLVDYSSGDFERLVADVRERSQFHYNAAMGPQDKIISLSTCTYKYGTYTQNPYQRFVVMGRLLGENEKLYKTADIEENPAPKPPKFEK